MKRALSTKQIAQVRKAAISIEASTGRVWAIDNTRRWLFGSRIRIFISSTVLLAMVGGVWWVFFYKTDVDRGLQLLNKANSKQRPLESRLSPLSYARFPITRGETESKVDADAETQAGILLLKLDSKSGAKAEYGAGLYYLTKKNFGDAIRHLELAAAGDPDSAEIQADLGAALLEKGKIDKSTDESGISLKEFANSLEHLNKAIDSKPSPLGARFNRALLYDEMMLTPSQRLNAWQDYVEKDPSSEWKREAELKIKNINEQKNRNTGSKDQFVQDFLSAYNSKDDDLAWNLLGQTYNSLGNAITNSLIDSYLEHRAQKDDKSAAITLRTLTYIGNLELARAEDSYTRKLTSFYARMNASKRSALTEARTLMNEANDLAGHSRYGEAIDRYEQARNLFVQAGDGPEDLLCRCRISHCYAAKLDHAAALAAVSPLIDMCTREHLTWLQEQSLFVLGYVNINLKQDTKAIEYSTQALNLSQKTENVSGSLRHLAQLALEYRDLNDWDTSNRYLTVLLTAIAQHIPDPSRLWEAYTQLGINFGAIGLINSSIEYHRAALITATEIDHPVNLSRSHEYLGAALEKAGDIDDAIKESNLAHEVALKISDGEDSKIGMLAHSSLQLANLYTTSRQYDRAITTYNDSLDAYGHLKFQEKYYDVNKGRLLAYLGKGDNSATSKVVESTMVLLEEYRGRILSEKQRQSFFDKEQEICDLAVTFEHVTMRDEERAFQYSEMCRARSLLDIVQSGVEVQAVGNSVDLRPKSLVNALSLDQIRERMSASATIVQFSVLSDRLLTHLISKSDSGRQENTDRIVSIESKVASKDLEQKVKRFLGLIADSGNNDKSNQIALAQSSRELYDLLIKPLEPHLRSKKQVCFVPDKFLYTLPFTALMSANNRYFVEDYASLVAPSASLFVILSERAGAKENIAQERVLAVGSPSFDRGLFDKLPDLQSAEREANSLRDYYSDALVLTGAAATPDIVKTEMAKSDVIDLALHFVPNEKDALKSQFLFAQESKPGKSASNGIVKSYEIYNLDLFRPRLVVLSACQTAIERYYNGEGPISGARPFLARGVPVVVSSLWPVDTNATADLMLDFHRHRKQDPVNIVEALRQAQLGMLHGPDTKYRSPYYWASFITVGGQTKF